MQNKKIIFMTQTAVMLALLVGAQFITHSFGQFVVGALVNLILLTSMFIIGLGGGLIIAAASPFLAFLAQIGPAYIQIVPFIAAGNLILVTIARLARKHMAGKDKKDVLLAAAGLITAGAAKTFFLWIGVVFIALPLIPGINEKQIAGISAMFTWPQLVTALTGGALFMTLAPFLKKAARSSAG